MLEVEFHLDLSREETEGAILVTGFRGFGMVGYLVTKHLALTLGAEKRGVALTDLYPPVVVIEEDGPGYPFEFYYKKLENDKKLIILIHRANPEREVQDAYIRSLAEWAKKAGIHLMVLVGGLSSDFRPEREEHGYRWVANRYYNGEKLKAPLMEAGLGVVGPLALLYMYTDILGIPALMVLPYAVADRPDYEAVIKGLKVIGDEILGVEINVKELENIAEMQRRAIEHIERMLSGKLDEESREKEGMYM